MNVRISMDRAAWTEQPFQNRAATWAQQFGRFVLAAAMSADLLKKAVDQLPGIARVDPYAGVGKDPVLPADKVPA
jgi:hypothetical protein